MTELFSAFQAVSESDFLTQLKKDLKGTPLEEALHYTNEIEELSYKGYHHSERANIAHETPGTDSYKRGYVKPNKANDWHNAKSFNCQGNPKVLNQQIMDALMRDTNALIIHLNDFNQDDCQILTDQIGFEFIQTYFFPSTSVQVDWIKQLQQLHPTANIYYYVNDVNEATNANSLIDASAVATCGGNAKQEIAYALHKGHDILWKKIAGGMTVDEACAKIHFQLGTSSDFFITIAKIRAFRQLWSTIISHYQPEHNCSKIAYIIGKAIPLNYSLIDQNTNLLRQTVAGMAAAIAGVNTLHIPSYSNYMEVENPDRAERIASNISLILKEESYLDIVCDAAGGSMASEELTEVIATESWRLFQTIEQKPELLSNAIQQTAQKRINAYLSGDKKVIGSNVFQPNNIDKGSWLPANINTIGKELILERDTPKN
jgi:methylmalonyl-CoA mutase